MSFTVFGLCGPNSLGLRGVVGFRVSGLGFRFVGFGVWGLLSCEHHEMERSGSSLWFRQISRRARMQKMC